MNIRNATIARRRRKIGLSEQERMTLDTSPNRRDGRTGHKRRSGGLLAKQTNKAPSWYANWAEW